MELKELEAALEGVLFAAGEPVGVERLCLGLEVDRATTVSYTHLDVYKRQERDNFMTAQEAVEYGLIDKVIEHR